ncbi:MAG: hypothetical protein M0R74_08865 [Dehalococcoidia bacterium]|nr:hypothetical protein [Dehalococcoidia bacterium]
MPRPRRGLGQGLDALVRDSTKDFSRFSQPHASNDGNDDGEAAEPHPVQWEYACLERPRKRKGKRRLARLRFSSTGESALVKQRPLVLMTHSPWAVFGLLGEEGWELVGVAGRRFYFKRPLRPPGP